MATSLTQKGISGITGVSALKNGINAMNSGAATTTAATSAAATGQIAAVTASTITPHSAAMLTTVAATRSHTGRPATPSYYIPKPPSYGRGRGGPVSHGSHSRLVAPSRGGHAHRGGSIIRSAPDLSIGHRGGGAAAAAAASGRGRGAARGGRPPGIRDRVSGDAAMTTEQRSALHKETEDWRRQNSKAHRQPRETNHLIESTSSVISTSFVPLPNGLPTLVPVLADNLRKVVLQKGVSTIDNHEPYFKKVVHPDHFNFDAIPNFITSSRDPLLHQLAVANDCRVMASTSSSSGLLAHIHFSLHGLAPRNLSGFSAEFTGTSRYFTRSSLKPGYVVMRKRDGNVWGIDSMPQAEPRSNQILIDLGKTLERMFTMEPEDFKRQLIKKDNHEEISNEGMKLLHDREPYHFLKADGLLLRSQLDASDPNLGVGNHVFDLKTRATLPIRLDVSNYQNYLEYKIVQEKGLFHSFEREKWDMCRGAYLKYALQCRIGGMGGILVAYHNTEEIFGFEYISLKEMEQVLYGSEKVADLSFNLSLKLYDLLMKNILSVVPDDQVSIRVLIEQGRQSYHFNQDDSSPPSGLRIWIEMLPAEKDDPEAHLPWHKRTSSALRVDHMSDTEVRQRLRELGRHDLADSKKNMTQLKSHLEGTLMGDIAPTHDYCEKLIALKLLKCYDFQFSARNFPVELLTGTATNKVLTDDTLNYTWQPVEFPGGVGAELYRRSLQVFGWFDTPKSERATTSIASMIPLRPLTSVNTEPTQPVANVVVNIPRAEEESGSSDEESAPHTLHTPSPTVTTTTFVQPAKHSNTNNDMSNSNSNSSGSNDVKAATKPISINKRSARKSPQPKKLHQRDTKSTKPIKIYSLDDTTTATKASAPATPTPTSSSSAAAAPNGKWAGGARKSASVVGTSPLKSSTVLAGGKVGINNDPSSGTRKLFTSAASYSAASSSSSSSSSASSKRSGSPGRGVIDHHNSDSGASSGSGSGSGSTISMPAPSAPLPFMMGSDLSRLMANTSFLESMSSGLEEAEAASQWRARNVPAADLSLAGDAAAPVASTRHQQYSRVDDDYDAIAANTMLQQAFYAPVSGAVPSTTVSSNDNTHPAAAADATIDIDMDANGQPTKKFRLREYIANELRKLRPGTR